MRLGDCIAELRRLSPDITPDEIADIVWLASHMGPVAPLLPAPTVLPPTTPPGPPVPAPKGSTPPKHDKDTPTPPPPQPPPISAGAAFDLYPVPRGDGSIRGGVSARLVRVAAAKPLNNAAAIGRSLRPLKRRIASRTDLIPDLPATVERIAQGGPLALVMRPARERWLDLALLIDESVSMRTWDVTVAALRRLLEHHGAFRRIQVWKISADTGQIELFRDGPRSARVRIPRPEKELIDRSGRQLILTVSDCVSAGWQNGVVPRQLVKWSGRGPQAVIQMLPQRLWPGTGLGTTLPARAGRPGTHFYERWKAPQAASEWDDFADVSDTLQPATPPEGGLIPVVTLDEWSLKAWIGVLTSHPDAIVPAAWVAAATEIPAPDSTTLPATSKPSKKPDARVKEFRESSSSLAMDLASYLAEVPLSLPVMRLVQEAMLPASTQAHLAEVVLGGLMFALPEPEQGFSVDEMMFEFYEGVREELLMGVLDVDRDRVRIAVTNYLSRRTGSALDFVAAEVAPKGTALIDPLSRAFGRLQGRAGRKVWRPQNRWVLVAGTGRREGLPEVTGAFAISLGRILAQEGYALMAGGHPGVDYLVAQSYINTLQSLRVPTEGRLRQLVSSFSWQPDFPGHLYGAEKILHSDQEYLDASAVILIGGRGSVGRIFERCIELNRVVIPVPIAGGDAAEACERLLSGAQHQPVLQTRLLRFVAAAKSSDDEVGARIQLVLSILYNDSAYKDYQTWALAVRGMLGSAEENSSPWYRYLVELTIASQVRRGEAGQPAQVLAAVFNAPDAQVHSNIASFLPQANPWLKFDFLQLASMPSPPNSLPALAVLLPLVAQHLPGEAATIIRDGCLAIYANSPFSEPYANPVRFLVGVLPAIPEIDAWIRQLFDLSRSQFALLLQLWKYWDLARDQPASPSIRELIKSEISPPDSGDLLPLMGHADAQNRLLAYHAFLAHPVPGAVDAFARSMDLETAPEAAVNRALLFECIQTEARLFGDHPTPDSSAGKPAQAPMILFHSSASSTYAEGLALEIQSNGYTPWLRALESTDIQSADLSNASLMLVVWSTGVAAHWERLEHTFAIQRYAMAGIPLGTIVIGDLPLTPLLASNKVFYAGTKTAKDLMDWLQREHKRLEYSQHDARVQSLDFEPPSFVGRTDMFEKLYDNLVDQPGRVLLWGGGGTGKTTLALKFAWKARGAFDTVIYQSCGDRPMSVIASELARKINPFWSRYPVETQIANIRGALSSVRSLLVLDDVWHEDLSAWIPPPQASVLLTSQSRTDISVPVTIALSGFTPEEGRDYLEQTLDRKQWSGPWLDRLLEIAQRYDGSPLAVATIVRQLDRTYAPRAEAVRNLSFGSLQEMLRDAAALQPEGAQRLLKALAVCSPQGVWLPLAARIAGLAQEEMAQARDHLVNHALLREVDREEQVFSIHALARETLQSEEMRGKHAPAVFDIFQHPDDWESCRRCAPEVDTALDELRGSPQFYFLAYAAYDVLGRIGLSGLAYAIMQRQESEANAVGDLTRLQASYANQALVLQGWGRLDAAMELYRKQQEICERTGDKRSLLIGYGNQALVLKDQGHPDEALELHRREEALCLELNDMDGLQTSFGNQAMIWRDRGDLETARMLLKKQESICDELKNRNGLQISYGFQALLLKDRGELTQAMELNKRKEALCLELGNRESLQVSYGNQALILLDWGRLDEALELLSKKEQICEELGIQPDLAVCYWNQGLVYRQLGRIVEAKAKLDQALVIFKSIGMPREQEEIFLALSALESPAATESRLPTLHHQALGFVARHILTVNEWELLFNLAAGHPVVEGSFENFRPSLRRLRDRGLVHGGRVSELRPNADIAVSFAITRQGRAFLEMREKWSGDALNSLDEYFSTVLLIVNLLSAHERTHLEKLSGQGEPFFRRTERLIEELRHLRDLGLIRREGIAIGQLPPQGDYSNFFAITPEGRQYLALLDRFDSKSLVPEEANRTPASDMPAPRQRKIQSGALNEDIQSSCIQFLLLHLIPWTEYGHLRRLGSADAARYERSETFIAELRSLRSRNFISSIGPLQETPPSGDLHSVAILTSEGKEYLKLREELSRPSLR